ncbi:MAG: hypothetical protein V4617_03625 [Gemmatimonadota bacterium]
MRSLRLPCLAIALFGCASSLEAQNTKRCADTPIDSTNPSAPVYRDCHVERKAYVLRNNNSGPVPVFTPPKDGPNCYRATFEFIVDTLGRPEAGTVRRVAATDAVYGTAMEAAIPSLLFEPARLRGAAVRQIVKFEPRLTSQREIVLASASGGAQPSQRSAARRPAC